MENVEMIKILGYFEDSFAIPLEIELRTPGGRPHLRSNVLFFFFLTCICKVG